MQHASPLIELLASNPIQWGNVEPLLLLINENNVNRIVTILNDAYRHFEIDDEEQYEKGLAKIVEILSKRLDVYSIKSALLDKNIKNIYIQPGEIIINKLNSIGCDFNLGDFIAIIYSLDYSHHFGERIDDSIYNKFIGIIENNDHSLSNDVLSFMFYYISFSYLKYDNIFKLSNINFFKALISRIDFDYVDYNTLYSHYKIKDYFVNKIISAYNCFCDENGYQDDYQDDYQDEEIIYLNITKLISLHLQKTSPLKNCAKCKEKMSNFDFINVLKILMYEKAIEVGDKKCARDLWNFGLLVN